MTWLDVGNGMRNLYLLSIMLQAGAWGIVFLKRQWFSKTSRLSCFFTGVAITPVIQYLFMLVLALLWNNAPRLFIVLALPIIAFSLLLYCVIPELKNLKTHIKTMLDFLKSCMRMSKLTIISICFALAMMILLAPGAIRLMSSMTSMSGGDAGEYMGLGLRYAQDRDFEALISKEDDTGTFRGHSHFPSLELYMSYGLMHTTDKMGYPYDKPAFTSLGLLAFYMIFAYLALLLHFLKNKPGFIALGLLCVNLVPGLAPSIIAAPRDTWRILFLLIAMLGMVNLNEEGGLKQYSLKALWMFILCFTVMSSHVVCFVVLPFIVIAWGLYRYAVSLKRNDGRAGRSLLRTLGLCCFGALGTLLGFSGNIYCYMKWGQMNPFRLMTTYDTAPWYDMYMKIEYKLAETTTQLNFFSDANDILMSYATPIGKWGFTFALIGFIISICYIIFLRTKKGNKYFLENAKEIKQVDTSIMGLLLISLLTLFTLAPMTGILDTKLYSFSGSFIKLQRYTLQWFILCGIMIAVTFNTCCESCRMFAIKRNTRYSTAIKQFVPGLVALLCIFAFVVGTNETGYTHTYYRYSKHIMSDESLLLDNGFIQQYGKLREVISHVPDDQKVIITRVGYQYAIENRGVVLSTNPIVPLMNLKKEEIASALKEQNVALLATQPEFWDERYYALSGLNAYLETLPDSQVIEDEYMRIYILDESLSTQVKKIKSNVRIAERIEEEL